jgi:hypothetical protein
MRQNGRLLLDVLLTVFGLALFVYADLWTHRGLRLAAVGVLVVALVLGIVLGMRRGDEGDREDH